MTRREWYTAQAEIHRRAMVHYTETGYTEAAKAAKQAMIKALKQAKEAIS